MAMTYDEAIAELQPIRGSLNAAARNEDSAVMLKVSSKAAKAIIWLTHMAKDGRNYEETLENIREALGQRQTHHLVMADDVGDVVRCLEEISKADGLLAEKAKQALDKLRNVSEHGNGTHMCSCIECVAADGRDQGPPAEVANEPG